VEVAYEGRSYAYTVSAKQRLEVRGPRRSQGYNRRQRRCLGVEARMSPKRCSAQWTIHIPDHFAGDPSRRGHPADDHAVMAVQGENKPRDLTMPAGELWRIRKTNAH